MGNGARVAALAIEFYDLTFPSGLVFQLKNCYYVPVVSRNIILVSFLDMDFTLLLRIKFSPSIMQTFFMGMLIHLMVSTF